MLKNQLIQLRTLGEEAFGRTATEIWQISQRQHATPALQHAAYNRLVSIGSVKLVGLASVQQNHRFQHHAN